LVDFVLSKPKYHDLVTAPWVKANLGKWGGLRNRWATSLGLFVRALAKDGNSENAMQILDVLDVVSQQAHWTELLRVAGDFSQVRKSLRTFRNAPVAGRRMDNLAKKWQINWNAW